MLKKDEGYVYYSREITSVSTERLLPSAQVCTNTTVTGNTAAAVLHHLFWFSLVHFLFTVSLFFVKIYSVSFWCHLLCIPISQQNSIRSAYSAAAAAAVAALNTKDSNHLFQFLLSTVRDVFLCIHMLSWKSVG